MIPFRHAQDIIQAKSVAVPDLPFVVTPFPNKAINSVFDSGGAGLETSQFQKIALFFLLDKKIVLPFGEASIALSNKIPIASIHSVSGADGFLEKTV